MDNFVTRTSRFRLKGKRFHLTYSQCDLDPQVIYDALAALGNTVIRCRVGRELHRDGGHHRHVAIEFTRAWDRRSHSVFDIQGFHPDILPKRTPPEWKAAWNYARKDGDFIDYGSPIEEETEDKPGTQLVDLAQELRGDYVGFLRHVGDAGLNFHLAKEIYTAVTRDEPITITDDNLRDEAPGRINNETLQALQFDQQDQRSLVLQGPAEIGKSHWAKTRVPRPILWVTNYEDLRGFRKDYHQTIVFDDVCYQHRPRDEQLRFVCRREHRTLWARFRNIRIPRGVFKVFTCNMGTDKLPVMYGMGDDGIDSRVKLVTIS